MSADDDATIARPPEETPTEITHGDARPNAGQLTPGTILGGRYRVVSLIGSGGMGAVYRGDDLRLGQPIAMKFLRRTSEARERMLYDEVRIGRQISHPNVCRLYDIAEVDGQIFITMEFVDGEDLASLLRRIGRLPHDKAASVARDICAGLAAAHEMGVIHRDLKPGNVMVDGRGRARITDFGLAVAGDAREHAAAGTPAYMAPEQLAGARATVQSDIYALGLVLYELFTGRRVFSGSSVSQILEQQSAGAITPPSQLVKEIDPRIEATILRCLDPDPDARPQSVPMVLRELPSFDPLEAAVAAGETPSPAMVAAAAEKGDLQAGTAWMLLALAIAAILGVVAVAKSTKLIARAGEIKPPDVLVERTRELLAAAGLTTPPRDSGFYYLGDYQRRAPVLFVYRQSPRAMIAAHRERILTTDDPPPTLSGMVSVTMDASGRLIEMTIVPPQREHGPIGKPADYSVMFAQARIDPATLVGVNPMWAAPVDSDAKQAWLIRGTVRRVEAASYHGRPVWFSVIEPGQQPERMTRVTASQANWVADLTSTVLLVVLSIAITIVGIRNVRRGQGDRRGAARAALATLIVLFVTGLMRMHHVPDFQAEVLLLTQMTAFNAFWSGVIWMTYLALEPLVRRRWPRMLISWSRLLSGRWRDAMIGRDLLVGCAIGAAMGLAAHLTVLAGGEPLGGAVTPIGTTRQTIYILLMYTLRAIGSSMFAVVLLMVLRAIVRRFDVAVVLSAVLVGLANAHIPSGPMALRVVYLAILGAMFFALTFRFGLLAAMTAGYVILILREMPLTSDPSLFYFGRSTLTAGVLAALAVAGFRLALGGKRALPRLAVD